MFIPLPVGSSMLGSFIHSCNKKLFPIWKLNVSSKPHGIDILTYVQKICGLCKTIIIPLWAHPKP